MMSYLLPKEQYEFAFPIILNSINEDYKESIYEVKEDSIVIYKHMRVLKILNKGDEKVFSFVIVAITNEVIKQNPRIDPKSLQEILSDAEFEYDYTIIQLATYQISNNLEICDRSIVHFGGPYRKQDPLSFV